MTDQIADAREVGNHGEISFYGLASVIVRWRKVIFVLAFLGGLRGLVGGLTSTRMYTSTALFIPRGSEGSPSGLAGVAGRFGIQLPAGGSGWSPRLYVELLESRALLEPIVLDTYMVPEKGRRQMKLLDVLEVTGKTPAERADRAVRRLRQTVVTTEKPDIGGVQLTVRTPWPSVSLAVSQKLLTGVDRFNFETRKSQAAAERQFVEIQAAEAERRLRAAEERLKSFQERNRVIQGSPELALERDRLQRDVELRQQIYTALLQSKEDARIREVRDTPVMTVIEEPRLPLRPERRNSVRKAILGGFAGAILGTLFVFLVEAIARARRDGSEQAREFFRLVTDATPSWLRRLWGRLRP